MIEEIKDLAQLALQFGRTNRATYHEDGETPESDTDHTVMLGLVACAVAERVNAVRIKADPRYAEVLDLGRIAQFVYVHDLVEALCGDTNTLSNFDAAAKVQREREALETLRTRFSSLPWICATIDRYEALDTQEARFVKVMDKVLPKLTHALNGGKALRESSVADIGEVNQKQRRSISKTYGADQPEAMALLLSAHMELAKALS